MQVNIDRDTACNVTQEYLKDMFDLLTQNKNSKFCVDDIDDTKEKLDAIVKILDYILPPMEFKSFLQKNKLKRTYGSWGSND